MRTSSTKFERFETNLISYGFFVKPQHKIYIKENREVDSMNVLACVSADPSRSCQNIKNYVVFRCSVSRILKRNKYRPYPENTFVTFQRGRT